MCPVQVLKIEIQAEYLMAETCMGPKPYLTYEEDSELASQNVQRWVWYDETRHDETC